MVPAFQMWERHEWAALRFVPRLAPAAQALLTEWGRRLERDMFHAHLAGLEDE